MAIIAPSRTFDGSDLSTNVFGKVIKDGIRVVGFREERNKEGNFFFMLPPYKADVQGRGVSWKVVPVRDNFGIDVKEIFAVPVNCPIAYFASRVKQFFPDYAKVETTIQDGRTAKRYPPFGRPANKVIFNMAYMNALQLGAHVLTLPQFGGGEHIEAWGRRRMPDGSDAPLLNNPEAAIPIFIQLKKGAIGQPWTVTPEPSKTYKLPTELTDSTYIYNLDNVVHYPEVEYLIEKLRGFVPTEIFNQCMAGYVSSTGSTMSRATVVTPVAVAPALIPTPSIAAPVGLTAQPTSAILKAVVPQPPAPVEPTVPSFVTANTANPAAAATPTFTVEQARAYLQQHRADVMNS